MDDFDAARWLLTRAGLDVPEDDLAALAAGLPGLRRQVTTLRAVEADATTYDWPPPPPPPH